MDELQAKNPLNHITHALARGNYNKYAKAIAEVKYDGVRAFMSTVRRYPDSGPQLVGRRISSVTGERLNKIDRVPHLDAAWRKLGVEAIVDGEINRLDFKYTMSVWNSGANLAVNLQKLRGEPLWFTVFDLVWLEGKDLRKLPYHQRLLQLGILMAQLARQNDHELTYTDMGILVSNQRYENQVCDLDAWVKESFDRAISMGHEGIIVKDWDGHYNDKAWAKVKAQETYDLVICGYDDSEAGSFVGEGIAALRLGLYDSDGNLVEVTKCSGMTAMNRELFYRKKQAHLGVVVEVKAQEMFSSGALRHPRFVRIRLDANPKDQTFAKYKIKET